MDRVFRERRTSRRMISFLATVGLVVGMLAVLAPGAAGVVNTCRARNLTKGTPADTNLQRVIKAASPGDTIAVRYVCVGRFSIGKELTLVGKATGTTPRPVLNADGSGHVLRVSAQVKLVNLRLTGGLLTDEGCPVGCGGGIAVNSGTLTLRDTVVRGNTARIAGGIFIADPATVVARTARRRSRGTAACGVAPKAQASAEGSSSLAAPSR